MVSKNKLGTRFPRHIIGIYPCYVSDEELSEQMRRYTEQSNWPRIADILDRDEFKNKCRDIISATFEDYLKKTQLTFKA